MKTWLQPSNYERRYGRFQKKTIAEMKKDFLRRLGRIPRFRTEVKKFVDLEEDLEVIQISEKDEDNIAIIVAGILLWWQIQRQYTISVIGGYFNEVNDFNDRQFQLVVKSLTGLTIPPSSLTGGGLTSPTADLMAKFGQEADVYRMEPYLDDLRTNWRQAQEVYLDKIVQSTIAEAELIFRNSLVAKATAAATVGTLVNKFDKVGEQAERTGKDAINSLDVQLSENRQKSLGANEYIWETRKDERVRGNPNGLYPKAKPSHWARQDQIFNWNNPPEGGHPGIAPGCRCRAIMRLPK